MKHITSTILFVGLMVIGVMALGVGDAQAQAAKFQSANSSVNNAGALVVTFEERGLGNEDINYTVTADATAVYACINKGGNHPEATNKETVNAEVSGGADFEAKNGRVFGSVTAGPPSAGAFSCPSGQRLVLASVSYTNIVLTDMTNGSSVSVSDTSRIFFEV